MEVRPSEPSQVAAVVLLAFAFAAALSYGAARAAVVVGSSTLPLLTPAGLAAKTAESAFVRALFTRVGQEPSIELRSFVRSFVQVIQLVLCSTAVSGCEGPTVRSS